MTVPIAYQLDLGSKLDITVGGVAVSAAACVEGRRRGNGGKTHMKESYILVLPGKVMAKIRSTRGFLFLLRDTFSNQKSARKKTELESLT